MGKDERNSQWDHGNVQVSFKRGNGAASDENVIKENDCLIYIYI